MVFSNHTHFFLSNFTPGNQVIRLEILVQLFNAESHAIGIKPVHGTGDAFAKYVSDKFVEKMAMYAPDVAVTQNDSCNFYAMILLC